MPRPPINPEYYSDEDDGEPIVFRIGEGVTDKPLDFEEFKHQIDPQSGYMMTLPAENEEDFEDFVGNSRSQSQARQQAGLTVKQSKPKIYYVVYRLKFQQVPSEGSMKSKKVKQYQIVSLYFNT